MMRYAALLRGINVGGNKKIPMAALRELMQGLGYPDVVTHLQSGNAVFSSPEQPARRCSRASSPTASPANSRWTSRSSSGLAANSLT